MKKTIFILFLFLIQFSLIALPKILVDCVHGFDNLEHLQTMFPEYEFERLDEEDFPIENIIVQGELPNPDTTNFQEFYVSENTEHLYIITDDYNFNYDFFAYLEDPDGELVRPFQGILEIEDPQSGIWTIFNENGFGEILPFNYIIGTGPNFFASLDVSEYSAFYRLWSDVWYFFMGPIAEYSASEEQILQEWINDGLGFFSYYNCKYDGVLKPVIRLYDLDEPLDVKISFKGVPTYQSPTAGINRDNELTSYTWSNIKPEKDYTELLYEIGKIEPPRFLDYSMKKDQIKIQNQSQYPIYGLYCLKSNHNSSFEVAKIGDLNSGQEILSLTKTIAKADLVKELKEQLPACMIERGLPSDLALEFFQKYSWIDRLLLELSQSTDYLTLYLIDSEAYNGVFPLQLSLDPAEIIRQLWMVEKSISYAEPVLFTEISNEQILLNNDDYSYFEYGFYDIDHNRETSSLFDLTVHNDDFIIDPTNYYITEEAPIFHVYGNNEIADFLTTLNGYIPYVYNYHAPYIDFSEDWSPILLGDEDCYANEGNSEILCCLVGKNQELGRILVGGTSHLIDYDYADYPLPSNYDFAANSLYWITFRDQVVHVPQDYETINESIEAVQDGYTIIVDDGTYNESINFSGKNITLESLNGSENCIITPPLGEHAIIFENGESLQAQLNGFTITGTTVQAVVIQNASPFIRNNSIIYNQMGTWYLFGAGILCENSSTKIENNVIAFNSEAYFGGGIFFANWDGELKNNEIHHNTTNAGYGVDIGSGICLDNCSGCIENNLFYENQSNYIADAIICISSNTEFRYNQIFSNQNNGICISGFDTPVLNYNDIYGNSGYDIRSSSTGADITIDSQYNYWGEETTEEMDSFPFPSNITAIYDFFDNDEFSLVDYNNWLNSSIKVDEDNEIQQVSFNLVNYPNPFSSQTTISLNATTNLHENTRIEIYNIKGQKVKQLRIKNYELGMNEVIWNGTDDSGKPVNSGIYFYRLKFEGFESPVRKMVLMRN